MWGTKEKAMDEDYKKKIDDLHMALLEVPPGSSNSAKPLIEDIRVVVLAYKRGSWATRALVWLLPAIAGVGVAFEKIRGWIQ